MPTVISDASVLIDLGAVGLTGLLREFYIEVFVPPTVWREVTSAVSRPGSAEVQQAKNDGWEDFQPYMNTPFRRFSIGDERSALPN